jgi:hypothetical protein
MLWCEDLVTVRNPSVCRSCSGPQFILRDPQSVLTRGFPTDLIGTGHESRSSPLLGLSS